MIHHQVYIDCSHLASGGGKWRLGAAVPSDLCPMFHSLPFTSTLFQVFHSCPMFQLGTASTGEWERRTERKIRKSGPVSFPVTLTPISFLSRSPRKALCLSLKFLWQRPFLQPRDFSKERPAPRFNDIMVERPKSGVGELRRGSLSRRAERDKPTEISSRNRPSSLLCPS